MKEKQLKRVIKYENAFLQVVEDDVLLPNNKATKRVVVKHIGAACVLPITKKHTVILTRQYRYAIEAESLEIPAGKKDTVNEDGLQCAKRELEEETGYTSSDFSKLTEIYTAIGFSDELVEIFVAKDCVVMASPPAQDADEFIETVEIPLDEAIRMVDDGEIRDAKTVVALLYIGKNKV